MDFAVRALFIFALVAISYSSPLLTERQSPEPSCATQQDCFPNELANSTSVPDPFIRCNAAGRCVCESCFMLNETGNVCYLQPPCTNFNVNTSQCVDTRRSQLTAFLLSLFLSWTGAANFYINQLALAIPQLILGILACVLGCVLRIIQSFCCSKDEEKNIFQILCTCVLCLPVFFIPLIQIAWWIADLVIFVRNERPDSRGCPLQPNLWKWMAVVDHGKPQNSKMISALPI